MAPLTGASALKPRVKSLLTLPNSIPISGRHTQTTHTHITLHTHTLVHTVMEMATQVPMSMLPVTHICPDTPPFSCSFTHTAPCTLLRSQDTAQASIRDLQIGPIWSSLLVSLAQGPPGTQHDLVCLLLLTFMQTISLEDKAPALLPNLNHPSPNGFTSSALLWPPRLGETLWISQPTLASLQDSQLKVQDCLA